MKKILITSTDLMMVQFLLPHVLVLRNNGFSVEVACSNVGNRIEDIYNAIGRECVTTVNLKRNPIKLKNILGLIELRRIINKGSYNLVWTNEPVMGVMTRLAAVKARKNGTKVLYMSHGYHFFKGCPVYLKPFYFIEKFFSRLCDAIVTINYEDYNVTINKFHNNSTYHINGIGLDVNKYSKKIDVNKKKKELGIPLNNFVIVSVGELKSHKNHKIVMKALSMMNDYKISYIICGKGNLLDKLIHMVNNLDLNNKVIFCGYRKDINEILQCADIFVFPSLREGLGLAALEAMATGLPVVGTDTRGIRDYVINGITGYLCDGNNELDFISAITRLMNTTLRRKISINCKRLVNKFDIKFVSKNLIEIINEIL